MGYTRSETWVTRSSAMLRAERSANMPWQEVSTMSLRREFCALADRETANMSELCRRFGISRKTGYKWLNRYRAAGVEGLADRRRRPPAMPRLFAPAMGQRAPGLWDSSPTWAWV